MKKLLPNKQNVIVILSIIMGCISGYYHNIIAINCAEILSKILMNAFRFISLPILFLSVVSTISGISEIRRFKKLGFSTLKYTLFTTLVASFIGLVSFLFIKPHFAVETVERISSSTSNGLLENLINIIPSNFFQAFIDGNALSIVLLAFIFGLAALGLDEESKLHLTKHFNSLLNMFMKIAYYILKLVPLMIWSSITLIFNDFISDKQMGIIGLYRYILSIGIANGMQSLIVLPLLLIYKGINPFILAKKVSSALIMAFFTKSSMSTLPETKKCMINNVKAKPKVVNFVIPLCATINMNACAAFIITTFLTVSNSYGNNYTIFEYLFFVLVATIGAIGNAGVPMGCYFVTSALLTSLGIPIKYLGAILPFYLILDMFETAINIWSDTCITTIVDKEIKV